MSRPEPGAAADAPPVRGEIVWTPSPERVENSRLTAYQRRLEARLGRRFAGYQELWEWSVADLEGFWSSIWEEFDVLASRPPDRVLDDRGMPEVKWFEGARLNYAENALRFSGSTPALVYWSELNQPREISRDRLRELVAAAAAGLRRLGVGPGDRVAGYLPTVPEATIGFLAAAALGATWSCCSPDFGIGAVADRFRQIEPKVLIACDGYRYKGRDHDRRQVVAGIRAQLPGLVATVWVPNLGLEPPPGTIAWEQLLAEPEAPAYQPVGFAHPLWIVYSSGTTGLPKPIVHGHGGILLEHLKTVALQTDMGPGSRYFQYTTTGWMMWNSLQAGLTVGATVHLYDGAADQPDLAEIWRRAAGLGVTHLGTSAPFLISCMRAGLRPGLEFDLSRLVSVGSTGAPLPAEVFQWFRTAVGGGIQLRSTSGGTDICAALLGGSPTLPVRAGELQCRPLGVASAAFDETGQEIYGEVGELVVKRPMPSMPVCFWNDPDRSRLRASYFETFPGIWRHGDWVTIFEDGAGIVHGRSDATLNRGGIRIGTAELYRCVEARPGVADSLVVDVPDPDLAGSRLVLLVAGPEPEDPTAFAAELRAAIREALSPRHSPDQVVFVRSLPRTLNGKKLEVPIKRILTGVPVERALSLGSISDPDALAPLVALARGSAEAPPAY